MPILVNLWRRLHALDCRSLFGDRPGKEDRHSPGLAERLLLALAALYLTPECHLRGFRVRFRDKGVSPHQSRGSRAGSSGRQYGKPYLWFESISPPRKYYTVFRLPDYPRLARRECTRSPPTKIEIFGLPRRYLSPTPAPASREAFERPSAPRDPASRAATRTRIPAGGAVRRAQVDRRGAVRSTREVSPTALGRLRSTAR